MIVSHFELKHYLEFCMVWCIILYSNFTVFSVILHVFAIYIYISISYILILGCRFQANFQTISRLLKSIIWKGQLLCSCSEHGPCRDIKKTQFAALLEISPSYLCSPGQSLQKVSKLVEVSLLVLESYRNWVKQIPFLSVWMPFNALG